MRVGVISRGHGRSSRAIVAVAADSRPEDVGDEPLLIHEATGAPVVVGADRCAAAAALRRFGVELIISDDGLQHYRLARDLEIAVIDAERGEGNGRLLPGDGGIDLEGMMRAVPDGVTVSVEIPLMELAKTVGPKERARMAREATVRLLEQAGRSVAAPFT